jgi:hypothetical protein
MLEAHVRTLLERVKDELLELLPPTIFFLIAFHIIVMSRTLMLREYGVKVSAVAGATIGALLIGKVVLLADKLPAVNRFPDKPLIYNVAWKTLIYVLGALVVHYLEHLVPVWWRMGNLVAANRRLLDEVVWPHFWGIQLWLIVLLFVYCALRELIRAIGAREVWALFFGRGPEGAQGRRRWRATGRSAR